MHGTLVRRIFAGIIAVSFLLPWFNFFFFEVSPLRLSLAVLQGDYLFYEDDAVMAIILIAGNLLALWTLIYPKKWVAGATVLLNGF